ncbi:hypothetical protein CLV74_1392 [Donghicola tyrosinivorans]|uniref:Uncharacterized protein n=2 Tax=Donghicola tyrosinivorans TaxID=1652492 RepID=A0A2T0W7W9_9RHOB|nr:hypothetical protein CLV74_1392 [Donghicola tyrosinivorans]
MDKDQILKRVLAMFDVPVLQNNLRGLWVELMVAEILGPDWKQVGNDWAAWDLERSDGLRVEVKQSASAQSWGNSTTSPRFSIAAAKAYYPDGKTYTPNHSGRRLADLYIFAWHEGGDQRIVSEWRFFVIPAEQLPRQQKSIGLKAIRNLAAEIGAADLREKVTQMAA